MCVYSLLRKKKKRLLWTQTTTLCNTCFELQEEVTATRRLTRLSTANVSQVTTFSNMCFHQHKQRWREWDGVFFFMYVWGWEALSKLEMPTGSFHFTQNHQLHPTSTTILVCCFSAAVAQPAGEERRLFVVSQPERWEGFSTAYITCLFSFNAGRALTITLDGYQ